VSWAAINSALRDGTRGLPPGLSLRRVLAEYCDVPLRGNLTLDQVLAWADAHHAATGAWPTLESGKVLGCETENWSAIDNDLRVGSRGLPHGLSVLRVLEQYRRVSDRRMRETLTVEQIVAWADSHHSATGRWPRLKSGSVAGGPDGLTWKAIDEALFRGGRGLPGGARLNRFLAERRDTRRDLTLEQILAWADVFHSTHGRWPKAASGAVAGVRRANWFNINLRLQKGGRGLPGGESLAQLLANHRGAPMPHKKPPLLVEEILAWADAFHAAHGRWPSSTSGSVADEPRESWSKINQALAKGHRGLPRTGSLARLLAEHRNRPIR
jgi:hypothetical protein